MSLCGVYRWIMFVVLSERKQGSIRNIVLYASCIVKRKYVITAKATIRIEMDNNYCINEQRAEKRCIDLVFSLIYTQPNNAISCACRTLLTRIPFDLETYMVNYLFQSKKKILQYVTTKQKNASDGNPTNTSEAVLIPFNDKKKKNTKLKNRRGKSYKRQWPHELL